MAAGRRGKHRRGVPVVSVVLVVAIALAVTLVAVLLAPEDEAGPARPPVPRVLLPHQATESDVKSSADEFGISFLSPTLPGGTYWVSSWQAPRAFDGVDPLDDWFDADHGSATYSAGGGELRITGPTARMYVHDPELRRQWRDVEITMYFKRVDDTNVPYSGMTAVARSHHLSTEEGGADACDTRGYGARVRFDGHTDFSKETAHPHNQSFGDRVLFPGGMPVGEWIGYKYLVFDREDGVHLQLWVDRDGAADGGQWRLVNEMVDDGDVFGEVPCAPGVDPRMPLTNAADREGSESGKPNLSVYFRADGIGSQGLLYKWGSIREIAP